MSSEADKPIVLYQYATSPYAKRVSWYLALRGIQYHQCIQPKIMPRPDIERLGIKHRRIPILSIGRDVYLDSRLIIKKLEELAPERPRLAASANLEHRAIERLLESFILDGGLHKSVVQMMLPHAPQGKDPEFLKDRAEFIGSKAFFPPEVLAATLPEAIRNVRDAFEFLETTLLADGRDWVLKTASPSIADIQAVWPFHWLTLVPPAIPQDQISPTRFPKVFAWLDRFKDAVSKAEKWLGKPQTLSGEQAAHTIATSSYHEAEGQVDESDPVVQKQGLKKGQLVQVWPTDTGSGHKESGPLVGINSKEVIIEATAGDTTLRVHAPRRGFGVLAHAD